MDLLDVVAPPPPFFLATGHSFTCIQKCPYITLDLFVVTRKLLKSTCGSVSVVLPPPFLSESLGTRLMSKKHFKNAKWEEILQLTEH